jgi:phosphatidylinositol dimannoside acyltransferase
MAQVVVTPDRPAQTARPAPPRRRPAREPQGLTTKQWLSRRLAHLFGAVLNALPLSVGNWLADRGGDLFYRSAGGYRGAVVDNLRHVVGADATLEELRAAARVTFRHSARNFYDLLRLPHLSPDQMRASVVVLGSWSTVDEALARGKGIVFITGHIGAFDYAGQMIPLRGIKTVLVTARTVAEFVHGGVTYLRASQGYAVEESTPGTVRRLVRTLRQGGTIGLATDRDFFRNGVPVRFFGEETTLPAGAVRLALEAGAPIIACIARRHKHHHTLVIEEPVWVTKSGDSADDVQRGLEQVVEIFERHIRATPEQWVMFQRVWPTAPPPAISVFPVGSPLEGRVLGGEASSLAAEQRPPPP